MTAKVLDFPQKQKAPAEPKKVNMYCTRCDSTAFQILKGDPDLYCYKCGAWVQNVGLRWWS